MKTTVIYHSADFDGIFCREIARKFLPDAELIGWDFSDAPLPIPDGKIYVIDLPVDRAFGFEWHDRKDALSNIRDRVIWIDHHKSSIDTHPELLNGYRIDGVGACRLAWQWFNSLIPGGVMWEKPLPRKADYVERRVNEPLAVRLAGEYDIWDKRDPDAELFQHGLRSCELTDNLWDLLLVPFEPERDGKKDVGTVAVEALLDGGEAVQYSKTQENAAIIQAAGFTIQFEGLTFLACNHARYNSFLFTAGLKPEHDGCLGFAWRNGKWNVSLYHAPGKEHHDLSKIAMKHGGGGHKGACGFTATELPFVLPT